MTDLCLKQINHATQIEPNKIQVPYTNGISETFEDTLVAMLIVFRDVSPTLSIWEAFELRDSVSPFCISHQEGHLALVKPSYDLNMCMVQRNIMLIVAH